MKFVLLLNFISRQHSCDAYSAEKINSRQRKIWNSWLFYHRKLKCFSLTSHGRITSKSYYATKLYLAAKYQSSTYFAAKKFCDRNNFEIYSTNKNPCSISHRRIISKAYSASLFHQDNLWHLFWCSSRVTIKGFPAAK